VGGVTYGISAFALVAVADGGDWFTDGEGREEYVADEVTVAGLDMVEATAGVRSPSPLGRE
jgi:hypothetical protein